MRWAKTHRRVRFELTGSGVPSVERGEFDPEGGDPPIEPRGTYGDPELIEAIARRYGVEREMVVPVPGASSGIFVSLAVAAEPGSLLVVEEPLYDPVARAAELLHLRIEKLRRIAPDFAVTESAVEAALERGACGVFLTNLHNPSGHWLSAERLLGLANRCGDRGAVLVVDEAYHDGRTIVRAEPPATVARLSSHAVAINTLTKVYGLSGLRIGWVLARPDLAHRAREIMDVLSVVNAGPSMRLAVRAFAGIEVLERRFSAIYRDGQRVFREWLQGEKRVSGYANHGAVFEWIRLPAGYDSARFNALLVERFETQVVPGAFFGAADHVRIGVAVAPEIVAEGLSRISQAFDEYERQGGCC